MEDHNWDLLLRRIASHNCTPFLGAGAAAGILPLGSDIAKDWARIEGYPLDDPHDLARVAQFLGVHNDDAIAPKERICELLEKLGSPDFNQHDEPHGVLAQMPFPLYITTNYDDFMFRALQFHRKAPAREICRWNSMIQDQHGPFSDKAFVATPDNPVVYHLHGRCGVKESIVLTEDDYFDFLVAISEDDLLPHQLVRALAGTSLLFIGYKLADWDFRVIHRGLVKTKEPSLRRLSVTVQLPDTDEARRYLDKYFANMNVQVYWGTANEFIAELCRRWDEFSA